MVKNTGLSLQGEQAEQNTALIVSIKRLQERADHGIKLWDEYIQTLHFLHSKLTLETDAPAVERLIAIVQKASDGLKKANDAESSALHILETTNEVIKTSLAERDKLVEKLNLEVEKSVEKFKKGDS